MAKATFNLPKKFLSKISSLGDKTDEICEKMLNAGADVVKNSMAAEMSAVIGKDTKYKSKSTGELKISLGISPMKVDKSGVLNVKIGFKEPRSDGGVNARVANVLEYGKSGQPPKPILKPTKTASRKDAIKAMQSEFEKEVEKL